MNWGELCRGCVIVCVCRRVLVYLYLLESAVAVIRHIVLVAWLIKYVKLTLLLLNIVPATIGDPDVIFVCELPSYHLLSVLLTSTLLSVCIYVDLFCFWCVL